MRSYRIWSMILLTSSTIVACPCHIAHSETIQSVAPERAVYRWLVAQQGKSGLVGNQEGEDFSGLYVNALAAICFIHQGDIKRAERIFDVLQQHCQAAFATNTPGGFHQFWDAAKGVPHADTDRWTGDNAWLLISLNYYRHRADRSDYDDMRKGIARWLISLQDDDGGIRSGFNKNGPMTSKSTEANLDCYAALAEYPESRRRVFEWLTTKMWVAGEQRLRMGSTVDESPLDTTSWGIAALGRAFTNLLPYTEAHFIRTDDCEATGVNVTGFADFLAKRRIWFEGTGQMVVAYKVAGQHEKAARFLREMERAMILSEKLPDAVGLPCSSSDPAWVGATRKIFVPSQAWYLFGQWGLNPMDENSW